MYVKIRFKNWGLPCCFLSSRDQKIKNITKVWHTRLFLFTFLVSFFMAFFAQKQICTINIWFNFVPDSLFEQDHLLNLIVLGAYAKRWPRYKNWCSPKSDRRFFFLTLTVRRPFHRKDFKWKKIWGYRATFLKNRSFACRT